METDINKKCKWLNTKIDSALGRCSTLTTLRHDGIGEDFSKSTTSSTGRSSSSFNTHGLPATSFIQPMSVANVSSSSIQSHSRRLRTSHVNSKAAVVDPAVVVPGRYIKVNQARTGRPKKYVVGTITSASQSKTDVWHVLIDGTELQLHSNEFENAFPPGQRVLVNWQSSGEMLLGCVVKWNGSPFYDCWFDIDNKIATVFASELQISVVALPKAFPTKFHGLVDGSQLKVEFKTNELELEGNLGGATSSSSSSSSSSNIVSNKQRMISMKQKQVKKKVNVKIPRKIAGSYSNKMECDHCGKIFVLEANQLETNGNCDWTMRRFRTHVYGCDLSGTTTKTGNVWLPSYRQQLQANNKILLAFGVYIKDFTCVRLTTMKPTEVQFRKQFIFTSRDGKKHLRWCSMMQLARYLAGDMSSFERSGKKVFLFSSFFFPLTTSFSFSFFFFLF